MQFCEVNDLLAEWKLSQPAIKIIIDNGYTSIDLLKSLVPSDENFKLLNLPSMPDRTMYSMKWKEWTMQKVDNLSNPLATLVPEAGYKEFDPLGQFSSSESEVDVYTNRPPTKRPALSHSETLTQESTPGNCNPLRNLLEKSSATRQLLKIGLQREFRRSEQSELCDIILDHLLKDSSDQKPKLAYGVFIQWAKYVHDLFTKEPEAIWFSVTPPMKRDLNQLSPGAKAPLSASARPHGKLYDRYNKRQAIWRESRGLVRTIEKKALSSSSADSDITDTVRCRRKRESQMQLLDEEHHSLEDELENNADIITISNYQGLELSSILETAWKATWSLRKRYLLSASAGQYLKKFAVLCLKSVGPHLINIDLTSLNSKTSPTALYTGLRKHCNLIENRAYSKLRSLSKPLRAQQQRIHDLPKDNELQKLTAVLLLLPFAIVGGKTGIRTKASRFDAAIRFIFVAKTRSEGEAHLKELGKEASKKPTSLGVGVQPLVIAIGEDLANINSAFVVVDGVWFYCSHILEAVDLCFKIFYVFNLRYPIECEHIWQVLQFICYGIRDAKHDKYIIDVNRFLNEIEGPCSQETAHSKETRDMPSESEETGESSSLDTGDIPSD